MIVIVYWGTFSCNTCGSVLLTNWKKYFYEFGIAKERTNIAITVKRGGSTFCKKKKKCLLTTTYSIIDFKKFCMNFFVWIVRFFFSRLTAHLIFFYSFFVNSFLFYLIMFCCISRRPFFPPCFFVVFLV